MLQCIGSICTAQMVPLAVCARLPVSASLPGTGGVPGLPHARHWLSMLQEELHRGAQVTGHMTESECHMTVI